jgi:hypothetical protein
MSKRALRSAIDRECAKVFADLPGGHLAFPQGPKARDTARLLQEAENLRVKARRSRKHAAIYLSEAERLESEATSGGAE